MSANKIVSQGFGTGSFYGTPNTIALDSTSTITLTGTVMPAGQYLFTGFATGVSLKLASTANGVTGTYTILTGSMGGYVPYDGASGTLTNTTTSVNITVITI